MSAPILAGWLLFVMIGGNIERVVRVEGPMDCIERSHFEMRYDARVTHTNCHVGPEIET